MNTKQENILVDSCQYTPVYLVENTGAIQGRSFILTQANVEEPKPVTDNLKRYYENSGILETTSINNAPTFTKPRILKRQETKVVGNNLKLASFLLPKTSQEISVSRQTTPVNTVQATLVNSIQTAAVNNVQPTLVNSIQTVAVSNVQPTHSIQTAAINNDNVQVPLANSIQTASVSNVVYKPIITASVVHTVPKVEVERKIVRLKNFPAKFKPTPRERVLPKIKPKDDPPNPNPVKRTSVQLLKLGETYHSLNQLSDDQMKMVNQALKIFSNPEKGSMEPTYDPVTNTRFIYKVVSPRDLTVVGKNKLKREELVEKEITEVKKEEIVRELKKDEILKEVKREYKKAKEEEAEPAPPVTAQVKVTRSGRKVKSPKQIIEEIKPTKRRNGVSCFHCSTEFCNMYRLQKHYENHPTHIPAKIHSNLFHCLMAIIKSGSEEDRTSIFIQQLEQLIEKLKLLLPCLLRNIDGIEGKPCTISDNISRLFGIIPGKYNLNLDGLTCVKDKDGNCRHNPPLPKKNLNIESQSPVYNTIHLEETANESETEDCARVNSIDKWAIANKRFRKIKQQKTDEINAKRIKLASESADANIELDDLIISNGDFSLPVEQSANNIQPETTSLLENVIDKECDNCTQQPDIVTGSPSATINGLPTVISDQHPVPNKRIRNIKQQKQQDTNAKKLKPKTDNTETAIELNDYVICNSSYTLPREHNADNVQADAISLLDNLIGEESNDCIQQPVVHLKDTQKSATVNDLPKKAKGAHTQFHSAHFDIRSSPIKTSSAATFRKFQINPEKLAKYEVQIIRPLELDKTPAEEVSMNPRLDVTDKSEAAQCPEAVVLEDSAISNSDNSVLQSIFRDDLIELTCKDPNDIPNDLDFAAAKEWISSGLNLVDKTDDDFIKTNSLDESFIRGSSLIEPALLHCKEDSHNKLVLENNMTATDHISSNDNHLLNQGSASVLNFLDSLGSECLSYPETEIRNNNVDFQLDLFSFSNT